MATKGKLTCLLHPQRKKTVSNTNILRKWKFFNPSNGAEKIIKKNPMNFFLLFSFWGGGKRKKNSNKNAKINKKKENKISIVMAGL